MTKREKAQIALDAAYYLGEAALLLMQICEVDMSNIADELGKDALKLEAQYNVEADIEEQLNERALNREYEREAL